MSTLYEFPQRADPLEEACDWQAKLDRGLAGSEAAELQDWLAADPAHASALRKVAGNWYRMEALSRLADLFPRPQARQAGWPRQLSAVAATVLVAVMGLWWMLGGEVEHVEHGNHTPAMAVHSPVLLVPQLADQTFETAIGKSSTVDLADGSQIVLNTNTQIQMRFTDKQRHVELKRGEINVRVAHDKSRPFDVYAGNKVVRAFGTTFNVRLKSKNLVELIVSEGKVGVGVIDDGNAGSDRKEILRQPETFTTFVQAGQQVILGAKDEEVTEINPDKIGERQSWQKGTLEFRGERLKDVVDEVNRYSPVKVTIEGAALKERQIAGFYKVGDLAGLLASLQANFNVSHKYISAQEVVLTEK